jgi:hypothetical protein
MPARLTRVVALASIVSLSVTTLAAPTRAQDRPSAEAAAQPADPPLPRRFVGRLEITSGVLALGGAGALGMLGAFLNGPPLFCGLFSDDLDDDCAPQHEGGWAFGLGAVTAIAGVALLAVGGHTVRRRRSMLRRLDAPKVSLRPSITFGQGRAAATLTLGARF